MVMNRLNILLISILAACVLLPFSNRAFLIDDEYHFTVAKQILEHPLRPYDFKADELGGEMNGWNRGETPWLINPPLMHYFLALGIKIFGENTTLIRIYFIIFPLISAICMYCLAAEFTAYPLFAALLMVFTPAFLVTSTGLMIDSVLLAFYLLTLVLFIKGEKNKNYLLLVFSGICMGLALLTKYTGISVVFMVALWMFYRWKNIGNRKFYAVYFAIPALMFLLWSISNIISYGQAHLLACFRDNLVSMGPAWMKILSMLVFFSGSLIFPAFIVFRIFNNGKTIPAFSFIALLACYFLFSSDFGGFTQKQSIMISLFIFFSLAYLLLVLKKYSKLKINKNTVLLLWLAITLIVIARSMSGTAARYYLVSIPPAVLLFINFYDENFGNKKYFRLFLSITCIITLVSGLAVTYSDYLQADVNRRIAADATSDIKTIRHNKAYFIGNSFTGMHYYMKKFGWQPLFTGTVLQNNDLVLLSEMISRPISMAFLPQIQKEQKNFKYIKSYVYTSRFPVRIMNKNDSAGLYSSFFGSLPFAFSSEPIEIFHLYSYKTTILNLF